MLRAVVRAALLAGWALLLCTATALAQSPPPGWAALIPAGQYRTLAWREGALFIYLLQAAGASPGARIFTADVVDLGVRGRDDVLAEIASRHARALESHEALVEPVTTPEGVVAYLIRHQEVTHSARLDGRGGLTLYVRSRAHAESGGGAGGAGGAGGGM
jgi:hypothetical protein